MSRRSIDVSTAMATLATMELVIVWRHWISGHLYECLMGFCCQINQAYEGCRLKSHF